ELVAGVWVGFDDNQSTKLTGGSAAAPIWGEFMKCGRPFVPDAEFIPPDDIVFVKIDSESGQRATPQCPKDQVVTEIFLRGYEPREECAFHSGKRLRKNDNERYESPAPPRQKRERRGFWESIFG
ncbi:MAG: hypothetical protein KDD64_09015, partial [Bdellovibrionales bacterium]|nr:hypothetical protein [Bdellovibrionales bacterium]